MKHLLICLIACLLSACSATDMSAPLKQGVSAIPKEPIDLSVEQIKQLRPQAKPPLKVALISPRTNREFAPDEREAILEWGKRIQALGYIKSLEIVPQSMLSGCGYQSEPNCFVNQARQGGARLGADALLYISGNAVTDSYVNPLSFLDITIAGMWLVPGHHRDSYAVYEAALYDINNNYLFGVAEASGEAKTIRPYAYAERNTGQAEAKIEALNKLGQKLYDMAKQQMP